MITDAALAVLHSVDFTTMVNPQTDGSLDFCDPRSFRRRRDGAPLSEREVDLLATVTRAELDRWIGDVLARADRAKLDLVNEWTRQPDLSLRQLVSRLPEPSRSQTMALLGIALPPLAGPHDEVDYIEVADLQPSRRAGR